VITLQSNRLRITFVVLTLALLVAGWWYWNRDLTADPPPDFSGISQSLSTDPALYTYHARNRILFGQADPLGDSRWIPFEKSFAGLLATGWFWVTSPNIEHGRQVGIFLSFAALILFLLALWKHHRPWVVAAVAFVCLTNCILYVYGRYPFLEISLMFFAGLVFFFYSRWGDRWWGIGLAVCGVALATITGKIFGVLLLPALMAADWVSSAKGTRLRRLGMMAALFVVVSTLLAVLLYGSDLSNALGFLREKTYESRGIPTGLSSPWALVESVITFGFRSGLYVHSPELLGYLTVAFGLLIIGRYNRPKLLTELPRTTLFALFWVLCTWLGMAPQAMCPTRYLLTFVPAVVLLFFSLIDFVHSRSDLWQIRFTWLQAVGVGVTAWVVATQLFMRWWFAGETQFDYAKCVAYGLPLGVAAVLFARFLFERFHLRLKSWFLIGILMISLAGTIGSTAYTFTRTGLSERQYSILTANTDLGLLLGPGAVVSGPYAAAFTQQNQIMSHPHFYGDSWSDSSLFVRLPITHLAVDRTNFDKARQQSRSLESARPVTGYWIGPHEIMIFRISQVYDNPAANRYQNSPYEQASVLYDANQYDSALAVLSAYPDLVKNSRSAALVYARAGFKADLDTEAVHNYMVLHRLYPTDFQVTFEAANALHQIGEIRGDSALVGVAQSLYEEASRINPRQGQKVLDLYNQTVDYFKSLRAKRSQKK
jgi:hypothetical protein